MDFELSNSLIWHVLYLNIYLLYISLNYMFKIIMFGNPFLSLGKRFFIKTMVIYHFLKVFFISRRQSLLPNIRIIDYTISSLNSICI